MSNSALGRKTHCLSVLWIDTVLGTIDILQQSFTQGLISFFLEINVREVGIEWSEKRLR